MTIWVLSVILGLWGFVAGAACREEEWAWFAGSCCAGFVISAIILHLATA